jgi:guanylate cyclase soluble subunit beta
MESHGVPDYVHISQSTYDEVKELGLYDFIDRGEMLVKGKGSMRTYLVKPLPDRVPYMPVCFSPMPQKTSTPRKTSSFRLESENIANRVMSLRSNRVVPE